MLFEFIAAYYAGKYLFSNCNNDPAVWQNVLLIKEQVNDEVIAELENSYHTLSGNEKSEISKNMKLLRDNLKSVRKLVNDKKLRKEIDELMKNCERIESICNRWF
ncbi:MAG: hypothetical protein KGZ58_07305 [Ignavibacteriales bacterium]|nr:hypothetical protein [Ignavibacteriales bacterium]